MQRFGPAQQPFELSDGILAFTLYLAGVPFLATRNRYSAAILKELGFKGEIDLCEAAKECVAQNQKGDMKYLFQKTPQLRGLLKIFSDQQAIIKKPKGKQDAKDAIRELMERFSGDDISLEETVIRLACIILKLRGPFLNRWKESSPQVVAHRPGAERRSQTSVTVAKKGGGSMQVPATEVEYPGFDIISANASDELKEKMGMA